VPWGRLSLWKWVPGISPGVKAAGAYGWWPTILVVTKVKKIRGLNLPGTSWATTACRGILLISIPHFFVMNIQAIFSSVYSFFLQFISESRQSTLRQRANKSASTWDMCRTWKWSLRFQNMRDISWQSSGILISKGQLLSDNRNWCHVITLAFLHNAYIIFLSLLAVLHVSLNCQALVSAPLQISTYRTKGLQFFIFNSPMCTALQVGRS